jgi:hypothetical protein
VVVRVTCLEITGRTRDELTAIRNRATGQDTGRINLPMSEDQREAAMLLMEAFASFIVAGVAVPTDIREAVRDLILNSGRVAGAARAPTAT